jgi:hypothetical protein
MALRKPLAFFTGAPYEYLTELVDGDDLDLNGDLVMNDNNITGLADPVGDQDAVNLRTLMAKVNGLDWKNSVRVATTANLAVTAAGSGVGKTLTANANGAANIDGVALALNDRVLVKNQTTAADNGFYYVSDAGSVGTPYVLTRTLDADQNVEVTANATVFVSEGTQAETGWTLTTNDPIVVDTTGLAFSQVATAALYSWGAGLLNTSGTISVELDTAANAQGAGADGGSSGLEFDVTGDAGKLRARVNATGGIERTATGLAAKLNGTTLVSGANGLSVVRSPQLGDTTYLSNEAIAQYEPVAQSSTNDRVNRALAEDDEKHRVIGLNLTTAGAAGVALTIVEGGVVAGALTGATANTAYYLQVGGGIGTGIPAAGNHVVQVGIAKNATDLLVQLRFFVKRAA